MSDENRTVQENKINEVLPFFYRTMISYWEAGGVKPKKIDTFNTISQKFPVKIETKGTLIPSNIDTNHIEKKVKRPTSHHSTYINNPSAASYILSCMSYSFNLLLNLDGFETINPVIVSREAALTYQHLTKNPSLDDAADELSKIPYGNQLKDIAEHGSSNQEKGLGDRKRDKNKNFHWEHAFSRSTFLHYMTSIDKPKDLNSISNEEAENIKNVIRKLIGKHQIVWVTSIEDKNIGKIARSVRSIEVFPGGWLDVYKEAGVDVYGK